VRILQSIIKPIPLLIALLVFLPIPCFGCTPIVPLAMLFIGPVGWGAVATTSGFGLLIAVFLKCIVFVWKSDFKSLRAVLYVIIANIVSTAVGLIIAFCMANFLFVILGIPALYLLFRYRAKMFNRYKFFKKQGPNFIAGMLTLTVFLTVVVFAVAIGVRDESHAAYWILKILFSTIGIALSLFLSVVYEEDVISELYFRHKKVRISFLKPIIWANVVAFLVVVALAAAKALPQRLAAPDFLIGP